MLRDVAQCEAPCPERLTLGSAFFLLRVLFFGKLSCFTTINKVERKILSVQNIGESLSSRHMIDDQFVVVLIWHDRDGELAVFGIQEVTATFPFRR